MAVWSQICSKKTTEYNQNVIAIVNNIIWSDLENISELIYKHLFIGITWKKIKIKKRKTNHKHILSEYNDYTNTSV